MLIVEAQQMWNNMSEEVETWMEDREYMQYRETALRIAMNVVIDHTDENTEKIPPHLLALLADSIPGTMAPVQSLELDLESIV